MPRTPAPLGPEWSRPFRVGDARRAGVREGRLRRTDLQRSFHGVRSPLGTDAVLAYVPLLRPGDRFSHTTAAELWGAPLPPWHRGALHLTASAERGRPRSRGAIGHHGDPGDGVLRAGVPVSSPTVLLRELAPMLTLDQLVAVADYLVLEPRIQVFGDPRSYIGLADLRAGLQAIGGRGVRPARAAAELAREGVESPTETDLRLLAARAGLPEPICGAEVRDAAGRRIGWFDLVWPEWRVIAEYDGDQHRTSTAQYEKDIDRFDRASAADWSVIRVRRHGLYSDPETTRRRLLAAFAAAGWRA